MSRRHWMVLALMLLAGSSVSAEERISFRVVATATTSESRHVLSETIIDGPPGTDFTIELATERYDLGATFTTDLRGDDIKIRCKLDTRRLYGESKRGLPLFEIDHQEHEFDLARNEQLILLPFGGREMSERLEVEIVPERRTGNFRPDEPLDIRILERDTEGSFQVRAFRRPHNFHVVATIEASGIERKAVGNLFIGESTRIPITRGGSTPVAGDFILVARIEPFEAAGPESVSWVFDLLTIEADGKPRPLLRGSAGATTLGAPATYDLESVLGAGSRLSLTFHTTDGD